MDDSINLENRKLISKISLEIAWEMYPNYTINVIILKIIDEVTKLNIDKMDVRLNILEVVYCLCWAPRYSSDSGFKVVYSTLFPNCDQSVIQYMYGKFLNGIIMSYVNNFGIPTCVNNIESYNKTYDFYTIFCNFHYKRYEWQRLITTDNVDINIRDYTTSLVTYLNGRYATFKSDLDSLYESVKHLHIDDNIDNSKEVQLLQPDILKDSSTFEKVIKLQVTPNIYHLCIYKRTKVHDFDSPKMWIWKSVVNPQDKEPWSDIDFIFKEVLNNITTNDNINFNLNLAKLYYAIVSFGPLTRGSASVADMFRYLLTFKFKKNYYDNLITSSHTYTDIIYEYITPVTLETKQLDCRALSTIPSIFINKWTTYFEPDIEYTIFY